jgi:hypothetical protein
MFFLLCQPESPTGLQNCLNSLQRYSADWKLAVNFDKTKIVVFSKQKLNKGTMYFYYGPNQLKLLKPILRDSSGDQLVIQILKVNYQHIISDSNFGLPGLLVLLYWDQNIIQCHRQKY